MLHTFEAEECVSLVVSLQGSGEQDCGVDKDNHAAVAVPGAQARVSNSQSPLSGVKPAASPATASKMPCSVSFFCEHGSVKIFQFCIPQVSSQCPSSLTQGEWDSRWILVLGQDLTCSTTSSFSAPETAPYTILAPFSVKIST